MRRIEVLPALFGVLVGAVALAAAPGSAAIAPPGPPPEVAEAGQRPDRWAEPAIRMIRADASSPRPANQGRATPEPAHRAGVRVEAPDVSDHNETDNDLPYEESLGERDFLSDAPFEGPSTNAAIGISARFPWPFGNRSSRANFTTWGGSEETEEAARAGLLWLRRHQDPEGFWDCDGFAEQCKLSLCDGAGDPSGDQVVTSLALLAFLGAGETHVHGEHRRAIREGLKYLKRSQGPDGRFGAEGEQAGPEVHAISTLVVCEIFALTNSPLYKRSARSAIDHILARELPADGSAIWSILAIRCAKDAGLGIEESHLDRCRDWLDRRTTRAGVFDATPGSLIRSPLALQVAAAHARTRSGEDPSASRQVGTAIDALYGNPVARLSFSDPVALHFGALIAHARGGETWGGFNAAMKETLLPAQRTSRDGRESSAEVGSWDPTDEAGRSLGRVGTTALMTLCLETYYRFAWEPPAGR